MNIIIVEVKYIKVNTLVTLILMNTLQEEYL